MTKTEIMSLKTDAMRMVAGSILDYARKMDVDTSEPGVCQSSKRVLRADVDHLFGALVQKHLQKHLRKLAAHIIEGADVVDVIQEEVTSDGG